MCEPQQSEPQQPQPEPRAHLSLRVRLAVVTALVVATLSVVGAAVSYGIVRHQLYAELDLSLLREANRVSRQIDRADWVGSGECVYVTAPSCVQIIGPGQIVDPPPGELTPPVSAAAFDVAAGEAAPYFSDAAIGDLPVRGYTAPLGEGRAVQVSARADTVQASVTRVGWRIAAAGGLGVLLAGFLGYLSARTVLRPVERLTRTAETVAATRDPGHRIEVSGHDELSRLAAAFNTMLAELEESSAAQRQLVADASHELRTPLTGLRANTDLLGRDLDPERRARVVATLRSQTVAMTRLVNDLIELARGDRGEHRDEAVRLDEVVEHCVVSVRRDRPETGFDLHAEATVVQGDPERLTRAVANLVDNAAKFSPADGTVQVSLFGSELTVRDHGPGIAAEDLPHVFDRFYRSSAARGTPGSGLGLAIVRQVADAHGAALTVEAPPDGGTLVRLHFPDAEPLPR